MLGRLETARVDCLKQCLSQLSSENRDLILRYYQGDKGEKIKNRKALTQLFGIPSNSLQMRALRLRERLHLCAENCLHRAEIGRDNFPGFVSDS